MDFEGDTAELALDKGFVDSLTTRTKLSSKLSSLTKIKKIVLKYNLSVFQNENHSENKLAVLVASGQIVDGEYAEGAIASENFSRVIEKINSDKSIKGLFLRINSPGGSGFASEIIRQKLEVLNQRIPIVVSMGDIAASGGYWISMNNNRLIANPFTLTGSIGVWAALPNFKKSFENIGILFDQLSTNDLNLSILESPNENLSSFMQSYVDGSYHKFIKLVSNSRKITIESVDELAQGRIWSGNSAVKNNLVDSLGIFQDGIDMLKDDSGIQDFEIKYISTSPGILEGFLGSINSFLETSLSFFGYIKPLEIRQILTKKRIDTNLICIVCPELN